MKRNLKYTLIMATSGLLLAGCCTTRHAPEWEYKVGYPAPGGNDPKLQEAYMNDLAKSGWIFVERDATGLFYFKRAMK
jgi:hypothetical protein